jgi:peptide deformylase
MWEGCLSAGSSGLFAKVLRYEKIEAQYLDEQGMQHTETLEGLPAQVFQHEVDHLNGILFMDHVTDPTTYMTLKEYRKQISKRT